MEKALKSPGRGLSFFQTAKNPVAEAKPRSDRGLCNQSAYNLHSPLWRYGWRGVTQKATLAAAMVKLS